MLYGVLNVRHTVTSTYWIQLSVATAYCLDYLHMRGYLLGQKPEYAADWKDVAEDAAIAILFGVGFHLLDSHLRQGFFCLCAVCGLGLIYNLRRDRCDSAGFAIYVSITAVYGGLGLFTVEVTNAVAAVA